MRLVWAVRRVLAATAALAAAAAGPGEGAEWGTFRGGPDLRGFSAAPLGDRLVRVWRTRVGGPVRAAPVAGAGRIYFHTAQGEIAALDRGGRRLWSRAAPPPGPHPEPLRAPLLFSDGLVVAGFRDGTLRALDAATGRSRWSYRLGADVQASANRVPARGKSSGGIVAVAQPDGVLHLVDPRTGAARWRSAPTARCDAPPSVGEGFVAYGNCEASFHVFDAATGRRLRTVPLGPDRQVFSGAALADGRLYGGDRSGRLTCADPATGRVLWVSDAARKEVSTPPAVSPDRVVHGADDGRLYALDRPTGRLLWSAEAGGSPVSVLVAGDRVLAAAGGALLLLRLADGRLLWREAVSDEITAPILAGDLVVVGTEDGFVAAYGPGGRARP